MKYSTNLGEAICKLLGYDANAVRKIVITMEVGNADTIDVYQYLNEGDEGGIVEQLSKRQN